MAEKKITISGMLNIDASKAAKALEDIQKKFKNLEKTNFTRMMTEDFKKLSPIIKSLDKDLNSMMKAMSKSEVKSRIKELNAGLKDQASELKNIIKEQEHYNRLMAQTPEGPDRQKLKEERDYLAIKGRGVMHVMNEAANEKQQLTRMDPETIKKIVQVVQMSAGIAGGVASYFGSREINKLGLEARGASVGNRLGSMAFGKNIDLGAIGAFGDFGKIRQGAREGVAGDVAKSGVNALGNAVGAFAAGGASSAGANILGSVAQGAQFADPYTRAAAFKALKAGKENEGIDASMQRTAFPRELMNMLIEQAPMKVAAMQGMIGAGTDGFGRGLGGLFSKNYRQAVKYGIEMPEAASMMHMMGQSGAIGAERGDISGMLAAKNAGITQPGEYASMISGMASNAGDSTKTASMVRKAMEEGVKLGVDRSMVKNLVRATEEIASSQSARISGEQNLQDIMDNIRMAVGGKKDMGMVGAADLATAQSAMTAMTEHTGSSMGLGIQNMVMQEQVTKLGGGQMSPAQMIALSQMKMGQKITKGSDLYNELNETVFGGDESKINALNESMDDLRILGAMRSNAPYSKSAQQLTTIDKLRQHRLNLESSNPEVRKKAEDLQRSGSISEGIFYDKSEIGKGEWNMVAGQRAALGPEENRKLSDESGQTGAGGLARYRATLESLQQAAAGQKNVIDTMKTSMDLQLQFAKDLTKSPIMETMADGTKNLSISMESLKASVDELNRTMGGKIPDINRKAEALAKEKSGEQKSAEGQQRMDEGDFIGGMNAKIQGNNEQIGAALTYAAHYWAEKIADVVVPSQNPAIRPKIGNK